MIDEIIDGISLNSYSRKTRIETGMVDGIYDYGIYAWIHIPGKQGLKQNGRWNIRLWNLCLNSYSRKTRIETRMQYGLLILVDIAWIHIPGKQGLKPFTSASFKLAIAVPEFIFQENKDWNSACDMIGEGTDIKPEFIFQENKDWNSDEWDHSEC